MCACVLDALVEEKFLCAYPDGTFARLTDECTFRVLRKRDSVPAGSRRRAS